ncbi:MAG: GGDEF domain-containing protein [Nitrospirota bacterium]|nr:MAG: GGDEF domain-containing protein [Nitrospirota bacterium]
MGGTISKVLRRGGGKKRQKFLIIRSVLLVSLAVLSALLYLKIPLKRPYFWFIPSGSVFFAIAYCTFILEDERFNFEFALFSPIFLAGLAQYYGQQWMHFLIIPYMTVLAFKARTRHVIIISLLLPLINVHEYLLSREKFQILIFYCLISLSSVLIALLVGRLRSDRAVAERSLENITSDAREATGGPATLKEESISHFLASQLQVEDELRVVLDAVRSSLYADGASFFERDQSDQLKMRYSTEMDRTVISTGGGIISTVLRNKASLIVDDIKAKRVDAGYIKKDEFDSLAAVCVLEGSYALGVLVVDSDRYKAFNKADLESLGAFAGIIANIVKRGRLYQHIKVDLEGLKILQEESLNILSTLNINDLCGNIVNGIHRISGEPAAIFVRNAASDLYRLVSAKGVRTAEHREFDLSETVLSLSIENRQKLVLSDTTSMRKQVLPFNVGKVSSILCFPMLHEDEVLGITVTFSERKDAFDIYQTEGIEILNNMASLSIDNVNLLHRIDEMALTDGLTGLFNHRHFQERLDEEIKRTDRSNEPLTLILTDIDHFKSVNDNYGHPAGDAVLREVSEIIKSRMRETDLAARYGGEEFALILTNTDAKGALKIAEDLRRVVESRDFSAVDRQITISLGISEYPADSRAKQDLIDKADQALYFAKENGRNNSVLWKEVKK